MLLSLADNLSVVFSLIGAGIFLYCMYICWKIIKLFPENSRTIKYWYISIILIIIFFFGYITNILLIFLQETELQQLSTSFVYILGAVFVLVVTWISYKTYKIILA